jgi:hypothetical protein
LSNKLIFRHVRDETRRSHVLVHLLHGRDACHRLQWLLLRTNLHLPHSLHHIHSAGDLKTTAKSICSRIPHARTSVYSDHRHYGQHLFDIQIKHFDACQIHVVDVIRFNYVFLLWHHE